MYGAAVGILGGFALFAVLVTTACASTAPTPAATHHATATTATTSPHRAVCSKPAPTTAAGYTAMFAHTPLDQWGGGDTAITVTLGARHVWLFSDTLSTGRFVHSTAVTQTGGCLHVSNRGAQLLPNTRTGWYWITDATRRYGTTSVRIKAETVRRTGDGPWDFTTGRSRYAIATVNATGDVTFTRWLPGTYASDKPRGTLARVSPGRVSYGRYVHRDIRVTGGYLVTTCRNWDDGVLHPLRTYAPAFTAGS